MKYNIIHNEDCLSGLKKLPDKSVHVCVTSPPYLGLRDYGTGKWEGGNSTCAHKVAGQVTQTINPRSSPSMATGVRFGYDLRRCMICGAKKIDSQIGLENSIDDYVGSLTDIFSEVHRVLRDDGTFWLNLGDVYSSGGVSSDFRNQFQAIHKSQSMIFRNASSIGITTHSIGISGQNQIPPNHILLSLLGIERIIVKKRNNNFRQVFRILASPFYCWVDRSSCLISANGADLEIIVDSVNDLSIVVSNMNLDTCSVFRVPIGPLSKVGHETSFSVEESRKPVPEVIGDIEAVGHPVPLQSSFVGFPDVYFVNESIPFSNSVSDTTSQIGDFYVTKASQEEFSLTLKDFGVNFISSFIGHNVLFNCDGGFVCYDTLHTNAIRRSNELQRKQELGIPDLVKHALMRYGWICRKTIIWAKGVSFNEKFSGACTPESCVDRPSTSHEYVFLFSKNPQYFYDKEAIAEKITNPYSLDCIAKAEKEKLNGRPATNIFSKEERRGKGQKGLTRAEMGSLMNTTRNVRSVWTIPVRPFKGCHFAVFPEKLIEPMIKAGTSEYGCCADCGSPYYRIVTKGEPDEEHKRLCGADSNGEYLGQSTKDYESAKAQDASKLKARILDGMRERVTTGWSKKCKCKTDKVSPCIVIDPFMGSGTVALVAQQLGRSYIGFELNPEYCEIAKKRLEKELVML